MTCFLMGKGNLTHRPAPMPLARLLDRGFHGSVDAYTQRAPSTSMQTPLMKEASSLAR